MKTFKEWLNEGIFDSRAAKTAAGAVLGGPVGAAIGHSMGKTSAQSGTNQERVGDLVSWHNKNAADNDAKQKAWEDDLRSKGYTDAQIFDLKKQKYENERKSAEEQLRKDQLGAFGRKKERLFGKR